MGCIRSISHEATRLAGMGGSQPKQASKYFANLRNPNTKSYALTMRMVHAVKEKMLRAISTGFLSAKLSIGHGDDEY